MEVKKGDIVLVHSPKFVGRAIQVGMNLERWRELRFKPFYKYINNHAAICYADGYIAEALAHGITPQAIDKAYPEGCDRILTVYRPKWTVEQLNKLEEAALRYTDVKYQFINFLQYAFKIFFGVWLGRKGIKAQEKLYCTEYVGLVCNIISDGELFDKYWRTSPSTIQMWCEQNCELIGVYKL